MAETAIDCGICARPVSVIPAWVSRYVGTPFIDRGHDFDGCACWGLVHLVFKHEAGIATPTYAEVSADDITLANDLFICMSACEPWHVATEPIRLFDVALIRGRPLHVGIMLNATHILHVWRKTDAAVMPIDHVRLRNRIVGIFRHRELMA